MQMLAIAHFKQRGLCDGARVPVVVSGMMAMIACNPPTLPPPQVSDAAHRHTCTRVQVQQVWRSEAHASATGLVRLEERGVSTCDVREAEGGGLLPSHTPETLARTDIQKV
jgi:hypothetical protein